MHKAKKSELDPKILYGTYEKVCEYSHSLTLSIACSLVAASTTMVDRWISRTTTEKCGMFSYLSTLSYFPYQS